MVFGFIRSDKAASTGEFSRIIDPTSCRAWLAELAPIQDEENLQRIAAFLGELKQDSATTAERKFMLAECVRSVLLDLLRERLHDAETRSTLLESEEGVRLWRLIETALGLRDVYVELVASLSARSEQDLHDKAPESEYRLCNVDALHRALDLHAFMLMLCQRARIAVPDVYWNSHCEMGKRVRQLDCHDEVIPDPQRLARTDTCRKAFVAPILMALADPSTLSLNELGMTLTATQLWAGRVAFRIDPAATITLTARQESKPGPCVFLGEYRVRFDTQSVLRNIARTLATLDDGTMPREWSRERGISIQSCRTLLLLLQRRWGVVEPEAINSPQTSWRAPSIASLQAVVGWQLDAKPRQEGASSTDPRGAFQQVYQYQRQREDRLSLSPAEMERARLQKMLSSAETWNLAGETSEALLCARRLHRPSLYLNQLVGFKLAAKDSIKDASKNAIEMPYLLAWVQGLQQAVSEDHAGLLRPSSTHMVRLHLFAGRVRPLQAIVDGGEAVHGYLLMPLEFRDTDEDIEFLLKAMQEGPQRFSLFLPVSSYAPGRKLRLMIAGETPEFTLAQLIVRGLDFDQVGFA